MLNAVDLNLLIRLESGWLDFLQLISFYKFHNHQKCLLEKFLRQFIETLCFFLGFEYRNIFQLLFIQNYSSSEDSQFYNTKIKHLYLLRMCLHSTLSLLILHESVVLLFLLTNLTQERCPPSSHQWVFTSSHSSYLRVVSSFFAHS